MTQKLQFTALKRLTIVWLGLVAFNILLSAPVVEGLFKAELGHVAASVSKICSTATYTQKKTGHEQSISPAFFGTTATSSAETGAGHHSFLDKIEVLKRESSSCLKLERQFCHKETVFFKLEPRGPPAV